MQQARHLKGTRVLGTAAHLDWPRLVPVGHDHGEGQPLETLELGPIVGAGELIDGVIDDGHGSEDGGPLGPNKGTIQAKGAVASPLNDHRCLSLQSVAWHGRAMEH